MTYFRNFVEREQTGAEMIIFIDNFEKHQQKSKTNRADIYEKKIAVHLEDSLIGWDSDTYFQWNNNPSHTFPLKKNQEGLEEQEEDKNKAQKVNHLPY